MNGSPDDSLSPAFTDYENELIENGARQKNGTHCKHEMHSTENDNRIEFYMYLVKKEKEPDEPKLFFLKKKTPPLYHLQKVFFSLSLILNRNERIIITNGRNRSIKHFCMFASRVRREQLGTVENFFEAQSYPVRQLKNTMLLTKIHIYRYMVVHLLVFVTTFYSIVQAIVCLRSGLLNQAK